MEKEQLKEYRKIKDEVRQVEKRIRILEARQNGKTELYEFYRRKRTELIDVQLAIENAIVALNYTEREIVRLRYFDNLPWNKIAEEINYSIQHTLRLHNEALKKLERK